MRDSYSDSGYSNDNFNYYDGGLEIHEYFCSDYSVMVAIVIACWRELDRPCPSLISAHLREIGRKQEEQDRKAL